MGRNQSIGLYGKMKFHNLFKFCLIKTFNKRYYQPKKKKIQKIESSDNLINKHCNFFMAIKKIIFV